MQLVADPNLGQHMFAKVALALTWYICMALAPPHPEVDGNSFASKEEMFASHGYTVTQSRKLQPPPPHPHTLPTKNSGNKPKNSSAQSLAQAVDRSLQSTCQAPENGNASNIPHAQQVTSPQLSLVRRQRLACRTPACPVSAIEIVPHSLSDLVLGCLAKARGLPRSNPHQQWEFHPDASPVGENADHTRKISAQTHVHAMSYDSRELRLPKRRE